LEEPRGHAALGFAGTPDRVGTLNGRPTILEIKTGTEAGWHGLQTAAQDVLLHRTYGRYQRKALYLGADGRPRLRSHADSGDYLRFFDALERTRQTAVDASLADEGAD
jgi:hypothetical protein